MNKRRMSILLILCMVLTLQSISAMAAERADGWYTLTLNEDSYVNIDANGGAVLRSKVLNEKFYVENMGKFYLEHKGKDKSGKSLGTLKMLDGRYLGISGEIKNGVQLKAVDSPYLWIYDSVGRGLRPSANYDMIANASGESYKDGTKIILWQIPKNTFGFAPKHADFSICNAIDPAGITLGLYRVVAFDGTNSQPLYKSMGGNIIGVVPTGTVLEVIASEGDWVKVKFKGREYYMYMYFKWKFAANGAAKFALKKVDAPTIVCSPWAKNWLSYTGTVYGTPGEWPNAEEDWTKPITRGEMAYLLVGIMRSIWTDFSVQFTLKGGFKGSDEIEVSDYFDIKDSTHRFAVGRLSYWGVIPGGKFNPKDKATYGDFTTLLLKLMAYNKKIPLEGTGLDFTKADIDKFAIGGDKSANAKITKEQAVILCEKTLCWYNEMEFPREVKYQQSSDYKRTGATTVGTGVYTIKALIGTKPNQPHLAINGEGKGELNNGKAQNFKITYKKGVLDASGDWWPRYTIQTMDGKFLAISGEAENGSRLITQDKEYLWRIISVGSEDYQWTMDICPVDNMRQFLNASASGTANGTPIITWFWDFGERGLTPVPRNCQFIFEYVGK